MKINKKVAGLIGMLAFVAAFLVGHTAYANPLAFSTGVSTATASTTVAYMTAGTATTTLTYDTYNIANAQPGNPTAAQALSLLVQMTASSTLSSLVVNYEYSMDGVDWYQDGTGGLASTTIPYIISTPMSARWNFASSTPGLGAVLSNTNRDHRILSVRTPTRYIRAIFTVPVGASNAGVYASFVPAKERAQ